MFLFLKSLSRTVHEEEQDHNREMELLRNTEHGGACVSLTVWRKSLLVSCSGFTVFDSNGSLVYRVDNYMGRRPAQEVTLMDGSGKSILTTRRSSKKIIRLVDRWSVYEGECNDTPRDDDLLCRVIKNNKLFRHVVEEKVIAYVYYSKHSEKSKYAYTVEGSYVNRSCKVVDESRRVVAEIKRKERTRGGISFGVEVFVLVVQPGFDPAFAMALVLLLDQMFS